MDVANAITQKVQDLSTDDQKKVLEFVSGLSPRSDLTEGVPNGEHDRETIWTRLARLGEATEKSPCDLPEDLAANHDHYLHGLPKQK